MKVSVMFRLSVILMTVVSLLMGGVPSVVCLGDCGRGMAAPETETVSQTEMVSLAETGGCCSHQGGSDDCAASTNVAAHPGGKCCCCPAESAKFSEEEESDTLSSSCQTNCFCCVVKTPAPTVVNRVSSESEMCLKLALVDGMPAIDGDAVTTGAVDRFWSRFEPSGPPRSFDVPLNVLHCLWTV